MTPQLGGFNLEYVLVTLKIPIIIGSIKGTSQFNSKCVLIMAAKTKQNNIVQWFFLTKNILNINNDILK